jgi:hypothetical protein
VGNVPREHKIVYDYPYMTKCLIIGEAAGGRDGALLANSPDSDRIMTKIKPVSDTHIPICCYNRDDRKSSSQSLRRPVNNGTLLASKDLALN